ncbi:MAG: hypothetical protein EBV89_04205, partial [Betaproteobacteria bacterium]|nr:hypothetical protein [Betaproteobacteria bacterium]
MSSIRYELSPDRAIVLTLDAPGSPVNLMNAAFREDFHQAVNRLEQDLKAQPDLLGVVMTSAKTSFFAGADLKAMLDLDASQAGAFFEQIQALSDRVASARGALRGQFMDDLFNATATTGDLVDAAGNPSRFLSPAQFKRFFDKNAGVAREIF